MRGGCGFLRNRRQSIYHGHPWTFRTAARPCRIQNLRRNSANRRSRPGCRSFSSNDSGTTLDKKRTILEIRGEKNAVPRVISCSIRRLGAISAGQKSRIGLALRWSSMISHVEQRSSRRESRWWFFFFVQGSTLTSGTGIPVGKPELSLDYSWSCRTQELPVAVYFGLRKKLTSACIGLLGRRGL